MANAYERVNIRCDHDVQTLGWMCWDYYWLALVCRDSKIIQKLANLQFFGAVCPSQAISENPSSHGSYCSGSIQMRESTGYLGDKDGHFQEFLRSLNRQYINTEGFLCNKTSEEGRFEILVENKVDDDANQQARTRNILPPKRLVSY